MHSYPAYAYLILFFGGELFLVRGEDEPELWDLPRALVGNARPVCEDISRILQTKAFREAVIEKVEPVESESDVLFVCGAAKRPVGCGPGSFFAVSRKNKDFLPQLTDRAYAVLALPAIQSRLG
jgi:hypothetical protein